MEGWWNRRWKGRERRENTGRKGRTRGEHGENTGRTRSAGRAGRRGAVSAARQLGGHVSTATCCAADRRCGVYYSTYVVIVDYVSGTATLAVPLPVWCPLFRFRHGAPLFFFW